jgi:tRNA-dihydrouridine synthase 1
MLQDQCDAIDLNLGCPQGIAKKGFYGSFLQDEWDLIYDMISTLHINLRIPVCAKMRIFNDRQKTIAYAKHICSAGVSILTVHGRTREMKGQKTGLADWDVIREIRENIPPEVVMFANGNIQYQGDVARCLAATGVDGVMSAEGHLYNPATFLDPAASMEARHPRIDELAREYLAIVKEIDDPMSNVAVKAHLFKIFRVALEVHKDLRGTLGTSHGFEEWERCVGIMEERTDKALKEESGEVVGIPWYRCQPYLRPERERERETAPKENEKCNILSEGASALEVVG